MNQHNDITITVYDHSPVTLTPPPPSELTIYTAPAGRDGVNGKNGRDGKDGAPGKDADPAVLEALAADIAAVAAGVFGDREARRGVFAHIQLDHDETFYAAGASTGLSYHFGIHSWKAILDPMGGWTETVQGDQPVKYWRVPVSGIYMISVTMVHEAKFLLHRVRSAPVDEATVATNFFYADPNRPDQFTSFTRVVSLREGDRLDWAYRVNAGDAARLMSIHVGIRSQATIVLLAPTP
ncbi:hypothetical protein V3M66_00190 [Trueperella pyogenes]|uniref:hypothetical protein n=1 Tax=Trueperella pyogenes TaxID=1661 RepID=UPI00345D873E